MKIGDVIETAEREGEELTIVRVYSFKWAKVVDLKGEASWVRQANTKSIKESEIMEE